jgi:uncharacterized membrane protein (GlpM family)
MSGGEREPKLTDRLDERPRLKPANLREANARELGIRFAAGAATSVVVGLVTLAFGPHVGGILLAFPAILAASLTLIEKQEDAVEAREDARGAIAGGVALVFFAMATTTLITHLPGGVTLAIAAVVWLVAATSLYAAFWWG